MIVGGNKDKVIDNIKANIKSNELNKKVEVGDPVLLAEQEQRILKYFYNIRKNKVWFFLKNKLAYNILDKYAKELDEAIEIKGLDKLKKIKTGAIITSNHFNPLDNLLIKKVINTAFNKNPYIVIQSTNLAMKGLLGYLFNHLNTIPISKSPNYIIKTFTPYINKILKNNNYILIYPEEEMWFNYKKPRPCKKGAYRFASQANVPVIPCFVEIKDLDEKDNDQFNKVAYVIHILDPIYPDKNKTSKENSIIMADKDYKEKCDIYEKVYKKKLDYKFKLNDIAGLRVYKNKEVKK